MQIISLEINKLYLLFTERSPTYEISTAFPPPKVAISY